MNGISMADQIKAIPTMYKGIQFRSRLEAKWASFFDLMNWKWQYEPCDFNGWIPDFAIYGSKQTTYVEVKPTVKFLADIANEIDSSGCKDEVILIGETCPIPGEGLWGEESSTQLGWIRWPYGEHGEFIAWDDCYFGIWDDVNKIGFTSSDGSWFDRVSGSCGKFYRNNHIITPAISSRWSRACNSSQWKRPQR